MHELSIALEVLDIARREAASHGARSIKSIRLLVGEVSGVEPHSLSFSFDAVKGEKEITRDTVLVIEPVPARSRCSACGTEFSRKEDPLAACPSCGGPAARLVSGNELNIADMEVED